MPNRYWLHAPPKSVRSIIDADADLDDLYRPWVEATGIEKMRRYFTIVSDLSLRPPAWFLCGSGEDGHVIRHKREAGQDSLLIEPRSEPIDQLKAIAKMKRGIR